MPPEDSAEPASPAPELELGEEPVAALDPELELEPEVDESPAHEEPVPGSGLVAGVVDEDGVVVLGSELVASVVVPVVVVAVVSVLWDEVVEGVVEVTGAVLSELVAGQPVVAVPVVVVAGVDPASTVGSVWVWVRPGGVVGVVLVFAPALVVATPPCLVGVLPAALCVVDEALSAALCVVDEALSVALGLCGTAAAWR